VRRIHVASSGLGYRIRVKYLFGFIGPHLGSVHLFNWCYVKSHGKKIVLCWVTEHRPRSFSKRPAFVCKEKEKGERHGAIMREQDWPA